MARHYHTNNSGTNLTSNTLAGATTSPVNAVPAISTPFYAVFDATNINGHYEEVEITGKTATNINHAATTYAHTTAEEVRFPFVATEADEFSAKLNGATAIPGVAGADGWTPVSDTWTYASASTITVPSGAAAIYQVGDKIKLTQTTPKYFYVTVVADTLLTVTGGTDYTVANAAITSPYYSHQQSPLLFPQWFAYTPTNNVTNCTGTGRFALNGRFCSVEVNLSLTGAPGFSSTVHPVLPITAGASALAYSGDHKSAGFGAYEDSGTAIVRNNTVVVIPTAATLMWFFPGGSGGNLYSNTNPITWATGDKIYVKVNYEI